MLTLLPFQGRYGQRTTTPRAPLRPAGGRSRLPLQGVPSLRARCVPVILISNRALPNPYSFPKTSPPPVHPSSRQALFWVFADFFLNIRALFKKFVTLHSQIYICDIHKKAHFRFIPLRELGHFTNEHWNKMEECLLGLYSYLYTKYIQVGYHFLIHVQGSPSPT